ncbi:MAG: hypothetical protein AAGD13_12160 [Pseudomonadota bacterium]
MISRRSFAIGLAAGAVAPVAAAHTLYPQWVAYRRKHLLIGCHRKDPKTYRLAEVLVAGINHALPKAKARAARAPHPERLASLIGTDQMEVAVLPVPEALAMRDGAGSFAPYGRINLTQIAAFQDHILVAEAGFPDRHAWLLSAAIADTDLPVAPAAKSLPVHPGVVTQRSGIDLDALTAN